MTESSDIICDACQKPEDYNTSIVYHCGHFIHYKCLVLDKRCPFCLDEIFLSSATYEDASAYAVWDAECPGAQLSLVRKEMRALKLYEMKLIGIMGTLIENLDFLLAVAAAKELAATDELYKKYKLLEAELMAAAPEPEPVALFL